MHAPTLRRALAGESVAPPSAPPPPRSLREALPSRRSLPPRVFEELHSEIINWTIIKYIIIFHHDSYEIIIIRSPVLNKGLLQRVPERKFLHHHLLLHQSIGKEEGRWRPPFLNSVIRFMVVYSSTFVLQRLLEDAMILWAKRLPTLASCLSPMVDEGLYYVDVKQPSVWSLNGLAIASGICSWTKHTEGMLRCWSRLLKS